MRQCVYPEYGVVADVGGVVCRHVVDRTTSREPKSSFQALRIRSEGPSEIHATQIYFCCWCCCCRRRRRRCVVVVVVTFIVVFWYYEINTNKLKTREAGLSIKTSDTQ